jgi:hypothetical protein
MAEVVENLAECAWLSHTGFFVHPKLLAIPEFDNRHFAQDCTLHLRLGSDSSGISICKVLIILVLHYVVALGC